MVGGVVPFLLVKKKVRKGAGPNCWFFLFRKRKKKFLIKYAILFDQSNALSARLVNGGLAVSSIKKARSLSTC